MRISEIAEALELDTVTAIAEDREVTGVYACDFLSRVMKLLWSREHLDHRTDSS